MTLTVVPRSCHLGLSGLGFARFFTFGFPTVRTRAPCWSLARAVVPSARPAVAEVPALGRALAASSRTKAIEQVMRHSTEPFLPRLRREAVCPLLLAETPTQKAPE